MANEKLNEVKVAILVGVGSEQVELVSGCSAEGAANGVKTEEERHGTTLFWSHQTSILHNQLERICGKSRNSSAISAPSCATPRLAAN